MYNFVDTVKNLQVSWLLYGLFFSKRLRDFQTITTVYSANFHFKCSEIKFHMPHMPEKVVNINFLFWFPSYFNGTRFHNNYRDGGRIFYFCDEKSVDLVRVASFRSDFLQNPYFNNQFSQGLTSGENESDRKKEPEILRQSNSSKILRSSASLTN